MSYLSSCNILYIVATGWISVNMHDHAGIIDGIRLCKAQKCTSKSTDMEDLESHLQQE